MADRCGACRFGLVTHAPADPQCLEHVPTSNVDRRPESPLEQLSGPDAALAALRALRADIDTLSAEGKLPHELYTRLFDQARSAERALRPVGFTPAGLPKLTSEEVRRLSGCPQCKAHPGERCLYRDGGDRFPNHAVRQSAAQRRWLDSNSTADREQRTDDVVAVTVYASHDTYPHAPGLFHVSCSAHPDFGACAELDEAVSTATSHAGKPHATRTRVALPAEAAS